jgi:acyl-coenzyme A thioesterase PaaI-like protein
MNRTGLFWDGVAGRAPVPTAAGRLTGRGRVVTRTGDNATLEGILYDADDQIIATATATPSS